MQKRWLVLLPVMFITYSLAYLDRANYSFGAAAGMAKDLNISPNASTWLGAPAIIAAGVIIARREHLRGQRFALQAQPA